jgi:hypothetical protein
VAEEVDIIVRGKDAASGAFRAAGDALGGIGRSAEGAGGGIASAGGGLAKFARDAAAFAVGGLLQKTFSGILSSVGDLQQGLIGGNADFEDYNTQFGVLMKSTDEFKAKTKGITDPLKQQAIAADMAKERMRELADFGAKTPFELPEVVRADKILQSFGLESQAAAKKFGLSAADIRTVAGDVASGTGASFEEISTYIGKFASGSTGDAINRFQELGIVTKDQLRGMGLSFDKGGSLIIKSQADLDNATAILLKGMKTKYGGMMDQQSLTFKGMASNLADWKGQTLRTLGAPIFDVLKPGLKSLLDFLPTLQPGIDAFAQKLSGGLGVAMTWLTSTAIPGLTGAWAGLQPAIQTVSGLFDAFKVGSVDGLAGGISNMLYSLGGVSPAFVTFGDGLNTVATLAQPATDALKTTVGELLKGGPASSGFLGSLGPLALKLNDLRTTLISTALDGLGKFVGGLKEDSGFQSFLSGLGLSDGAVKAINATLGSLSGILQTAGGWVKDVGAWLTNDLLPPVINAGQGFLTMLQPHIQWLADFANTTLMSALTAVGKFIGDNLPGAINVVAPLLTGLVDAGLSVVELALKAIATTYTTYLQPAFDGIAQWLKDTTGGWENLARGAQAVADSFAKIGKFARDIADGKIKLDFKLPEFKLPGFAEGVTNFAGGLAMVGERGPELLSLPRGSSVTPAAPTARMLQAPTMGRAGGGGLSLSVAPVFNGAIIDTEARVRQASQQIVQAALQAFRAELSDAVDQHILGGGTRP